MLRSLYSGVSGMSAHQTKMDVIGNNIANVSTYGFKASRVTFSDVYYQTVRSATAGTTTAGGNNASQIGYGSRVGSIDILMGQSGFQTTSNSLDLAIAGNGFFQVQDKSGKTYYTRVGVLSFDKAGNLVDNKGSFVLGITGEPASTDGGTQKIQLDPETLGKITSISIGSDGVITGTHSETGLMTIGRIDLATFINPEGLTQMGDNYFAETAASGEAKPCAAGLDGAGDIVSNSLEMSNVDLAQEFADMITTQRGFQANARVITTSDEILQELVNLKR